MADITLGVAANPSGAAGGQLSGTYPNPSVAGITETGGPTALTVGQIDDGMSLKRVGSTVVGVQLTLAACRVASTVNIAALSGLLTVDGVVLVAGNRVLVKNQTLGQDNGVYVVAAGAWSRSTDADEDAEVITGIFVFVEEGTTNAGSGWELTTAAPIVVGTTPLVFAQVSAAGSITAGTGLTKTGSTLDVIANADLSIVANANDIQVGVLATDAQHGVRGGGTQHAAATVGVNGFMSAADKTKLDGIEAAAKDDQTISAGTGLAGGGTGDVTLSGDFGSGAGKITEGNDSRIPTQLENDALVGTGVPSGANPYVSDDDARMTDSRAPSGVAGGDLASSYPNPTVIALQETGGPTRLTMAAVVDGEVLQRSGTTVTSTAVALLTASPPAGVTKAAAQVGISTTAARSDHKHDISTAAPVDVGTSNAEGASTALSRADHVHNIPFGSAAGTVTEGDDSRIPTQAENDALVGTGTPSGANVYVTNDDSRMTDSRAPSGAASGDLGGTYPSPAVTAVTVSGPTQLTFGAVADGEALTRSGATIISSAVASLTAAAPADVTKAASSVGVATDAARADHKHDITTAVAGAVAIGDAAGEGSATTLSRSDHTHSVAAPAAPVDVTKAAASPGASANFARADHKHDITTAAPVDVGTANAEGTSTALSRADHVHAGGAVDPLSILINEQFLTGNTDTDEIGKHNWRKSSTGTGSGVLITAQAGHPGIIILRGGTAGAARSAVHLGDVSIGGTVIVGGTNDMVWESLIRMETSIAAADVEEVTFGLADQWIADTTHVDGIFVRFNPTAGGTFRLETISASTGTTSVGTTTVVINTWYRVGFTISDPGGTPSVQMTVNGVNEGTAITTNIPSAAIAPGHKIRGNGGGTNASFLVDSCLFTQDPDKED